MVFCYERKGFIGLKECFRVSKTEDHYHQFNSWRHSFFFFAALLWFAAFFYCFAKAYSFYLGCHFFSSDLGMPLVFEFFELLCLFWLSHCFFFFLIEFFSCPPVWGVILVGIFFWEKKKLFRLKKGSQRMYLFQNMKEITKMTFSHFKRKQLWSINFDLI